MMYNIDFTKLNNEQKNKIALAAAQTLHDFCCVTGCEDCIFSEKSLFDECKLNTHYNYVDDRTFCSSEKRPFEWEW